MSQFQISYTVRKERGERCSIEIVEANQFRTKGYTVTSGQRDIQEREVDDVDVKGYKRKGERELNWTYRLLRDSNEKCRRAFIWRKTIAV